MDLTQALSSRRSIRSYTAQPVERAVIERLIRTATLAPSATNSQPWLFGVIEGREQVRGFSARAREHLLEAVHEDPSMSRFQERAADPAFDMFYGAPAVVTIYSRPGAFDPGGACSMAAYALMLAAHDAGLGTCWIGLANWLFRAPETSAELGVPADCRFVAALTLGHPASSPAPVPRREPEIAYWTA